MRGWWVGGRIMGGISKFQHNNNKNKNNRLIACNRNAIEMQLFMHYIILYVRGMTLPDMTNHALTLPLSHSNSFIIHHFAATNFLFPYCLIWFIAILLFHYTKLVSILPHTPIWLKITVHLVHHQSINESKSRVIILPNPCECQKPIFYI